MDFLKANVMVSILNLKDAFNAYSADKSAEKSSS